MKRIDLFNLFNTIVPTYSVGQLTGQVTKDCYVLRRQMDMKSMNNDLAGWDNWTLEIYSPISPVNLDKLIDQATNIINVNELEITNQLNGDFYDNTLKCFTTSLSFRSVKTYI